MGFFSLVTHEDNVLFSSFVNCIVLAKIYAEEKGIKIEEGKEMPSMTMFGSQFNLAWGMPYPTAEAMIKFIQRILGMFWKRTEVEIF